MKICLASRNAHKIEEINKVIPEGITIYGLNELKITEDIPEDGNSFEENAHLKAKYVYDRFAVPVFADDSGLVVPSLGSEPGTYSARYAGEAKDDTQNINLLLEKLSKVADRSAYFITVICLIDENGLHHFFEGKISGQIMDKPVGSNGFGYDPVFQPDGYEQTFAQLASEVKNKISHRAIATNKFIDFIAS